VLAALRPYTFQIFLFVLIPVAFFLDIHTQNVLQQDILGLCCWLILFTSTRFSTPHERRQVWCMVAVATCIEIWSSMIWGVYRYRFGDVPLWVPPGHGLVYLFALRAARTPFLRRHGRQFSRVALGAATAWALAGMTVEPLVWHRLDLLGALWWPLFAWFMRKPSAPVYAAAFVATSYLELWGTHIGNWAWQTYAPITHIASGNPPSVIAAGYCLMDFTAIWIASSLPSGPLWRRLRLRPAPVEITES